MPYKLFLRVRKIGQYLKSIPDYFVLWSSDLFDRTWYLEHNPDVAQAGRDPVWHYLTRGGTEGRDPSPHFCGGWYLDTYRDVKEAGINPLVHYLKRGRKEGRDPMPALSLTEDEEENLALIRSSGLFDAASYLANNPDVAQAGIDPLFHYLHYGGFEGRDLPPHFFSQWYLDTYEDVGNSGINPLVHYLKYGQKEGRRKDPPVFELRRMYDYSKQTNRIVFEDVPERIYMRRPKVIGSFSGALNEGEAECPRPYVSVIEDAIIFGGESLVNVNENLILNDELADFNSAEFGKKSTRIKTVQDGTVMFRDNKKPETRIEEGILLSCGHDNNYFHWLVECLPKLLLIDSLEEFKDVPLLIPSGLHKNLMTALERLNVYNHPLVFVEPESACRVKRLIYPSALSQIVDRYEGAPAFNTDIVLSHKWISMVANLLKNHENNNRKTWRKLFLARRKGLRLLKNQEQLEQLLLDHNFEIIDLDGVSLDVQIKLFSQASLIVAPTGAALTNMLFCQPGTKVLIFMSNHGTTNFYFWSNLGAINNLDVTTIAGERLFTLTNYWSVHDDYVIDEKLVMEEIKEFKQIPTTTTNRFFLMTRGRTGSTAVIDELNKCHGLCVTQELFLKHDFDNDPNFQQTFDKLYDIVLPYDLWNGENSRTSLNNNYENANRYLQEVENLAEQQGAGSFGFKLLSHHFDERPFLSVLLKNRGYHAIYLTRNIARLVLSGMIANQSGVWNTKHNTQDSRTYQIDLDEFQQKIEWETNAIQKDFSRLTAGGFSFIVVSYEEFFTNRQSFYEKILHFLGLPFELPPRSDWKVVIKDIRHTIANYEAIAKKAAELGTPIDT